MATEAQQRYRVFGLDGEFDRRALRDLIRRGEVTAKTDVAIAGSEEWRPAGTFPEMQHYLSLASGPQSAAKPSPTMDQGVRLLLAVALMALGLFFGIATATDLVRGIASARWPSTTATELIDVQLIRHTGSTRRYRDRYELRARYRYDVGTRRFLGERVSFGEEWLRRPSLRAARLRAARPLRVYYDPKLPRISVLDPGPTLSAVSTSAASLLAVASGILMLFKPSLAAMLMVPLTLVIRWTRRF